MHLIFIRHGQGEHNVDIPGRLNIENPHLTDIGKAQVAILKDTLHVSAKDIFIVSPTIRTIETANILSSHISNPFKYVSPAVGPRMFPLPEFPDRSTYKCDEIYPSESIEHDYPDCVILHMNNRHLWRNGINTLARLDFRKIGLETIDWIKGQGTDRAFIIAHDGTITSYRELLGESPLSRADFLGEAGWHSIVL